MRHSLTPLPFLFIALPLAHAQGTVPAFSYAVGQASYTLAGRDPAQGGTTTIPTLLVPVALSFESKKIAGKPFVLDAAADVPRVLRSPVFQAFSFPTGGKTQYADALLRSTFPSAGAWHTLLGQPEVKPLKIAVPAGYGYILTSKKSGRYFGIVDVEFLQRELFRQIPKQDGKLVIAFTRNTAYYALGDATVCCSWGTHGIDSATGNSFVLASYLNAAPDVVTDSDIQPLTQQLAGFIKDPLHDPLVRAAATRRCRETTFPAGCGQLRIRALAEVRELSPRTSSWNRRIRIPRTISRHRRLSSHKREARLITYRMSPFCPGTPARRTAWVEPSAFPIRKHSQSVLNRARLAGAEVRAGLRSHLRR
jgi:hypothetical protein